ncbi:hypothetical protein ACFL56_03940, partial [Candidatus Margulisiibacteriota bacterium]
DNGVSQARILGFVQDLIRLMNAIKTLRASGGVGAVLTLIEDNDIEARVAEVERQMRYIRQLVNRGTTGINNPDKIADIVSALDFAKGYQRDFYDLMENFHSISIYQGIPAGYVRLFSSTSNMVDEYSGDEAIKEAVDNSNERYYIVIGAGIYAASDVIIINHNLTIMAASNVSNSYAINIDGSNNGNDSGTFLINPVLGTSEIIIKNVSIKNNHSTVGNSTIRIVNGKLKLINIKASNNTSDHIAGFMVVDYDTVVSIINSDFINNKADFDSGAIHNNGELTIRNSSFEKNICGSGYKGGAIFNDHNGMLRLFYVDFKLNKSGGRGGAIFNNDNGQIYARGSNFIKNSASSRGGAVYNSGDGSLTCTQVLFENNIALISGGGAVYNDSMGILNFMYVNFIGNKAQSAGGAVYNYYDGIFTGKRLEFIDNIITGYYGLGGAIYSLAPVDDRGWKYEGNLASPPNPDYNDIYQP